MGEAGGEGESEAAPCLGVLRAADFQLAFLAVLTARRIKPASRWERPLDGEACEALRTLGLEVRRVSRRTANGGTVIETVFSRESSLLNEYFQRWEGASIDKTEATKRSEGRFFGYPACCVEAFVAKGYAPNGLAPEDQRILFHWACEGCVVTPGLLARYREVWSRIRSGGEE